MNRYITLTLSLFVLLFAVPLISAESTAWDATYFANATFEGDPIIARSEAKIAANWGAGSPESWFPADQFSVRWTRKIEAPAASFYRISVRADDGVRVYIDDELQLDAADTYGRPISLDVSLTAGSHSVVVEYVETFGDAYVSADVSLVTNGDWIGTFYNHANFRGRVRAVESTPSIGFNWGTGSPSADVRADNFTARWTKNISVPAQTTYCFRANAADGVRVFVDEKQVINAWRTNGQTLLGELELSAGAHVIRVDYIDREANAFIYFDYFPLVEATANTPGMWKGTFFNRVNPTDGCPVAMETTNFIDYNWHNGSPAGRVNSDNFSVRWTREITIEQSTTYCFRGNADEGLRVFVGEQSVINAWRTSGEILTGEIELEPGTHQLIVEYADRQGAAFVNFNYFSLAEAIVNMPGMWRGTFFNRVNPTNGCPVATETTNTIAYNWYEGSPDGRVNSDNFSARWTREITIEQPLTYCFRGNADEGLRVFVGEQSVINAWQTNGEILTGEIELEPGTHQLIVEYADRQGTAFVNFNYFPVNQFSSDVSGEWRGTYFNSREPSGCPIATASAENLSFDWGEESPEPGVRRNNWSVRWLGGINLEQTDNYCLTLKADDGARLWVDNHMLIDGWTGFADKVASGQISLSKGYHPIRVEYLERVGKASLEFDYFPLTPFVDVYEEGTWHANYYNSLTPRGCPTTVAKLDDLRVGWGGGSPHDDIPINFFSANFTRKIRFSESSTYCFSVSANNGTRVFVDDRRIINSWNGQANEQIIGSRYLTAGLHDIRVEYNARRGGAYLDFDYFPIREINSVSAEPEQWLGFYYNGRNLAGCPAVIRSDASLNFTWGTESPAENINVDNFSARWRKGIFTAEEMPYCFYLRADEGARVFVNGERVINDWGIRRRNRSETTVVEVDMRSGYNDIVVEYYERQFAASISLNYVPGSCEMEQ